MSIPTSIQKELNDYQSYALQQENRVLELFGLKIRCDKGLLPPDNTVTKLFGNYLENIKAKNALDVGCGTGILSLILAKNAEYVVGVDIDPNAVVCSKYNAYINTISNTSFVEGSDYEPVHGQKFDLIVSNPPFYKTEDENSYSAMCYMDASDSLISKLITRVGSYLLPEGRLLFVTSTKTDNEFVEQLLLSKHLSYKKMVLKTETSTSQGIFLWEVVQGENID